MATQIALLRGINVGKNKRIKMADLRALLEGLGYEDVRTLLQSGNAVYETSDGEAAASKRIRAALRSEAGMDVEVVVRTRAELAAVVKRDPLAEHVTNPKFHIVVFLAGKPPAAKLKAVDPAEFEPELFAVHGREIYIWLPKGQAEGVLNHAFWEKRLGVIGTARNWDTVCKLLALAEG